MEKYIEFFMTLVIGVIMLMTLNLWVSGEFSLNPDYFQEFLIVMIYLTILEIKHKGKLL